MLTNSKGEVFEGRFQDLTGQKFNRLTFIEPDRIHQSPKGYRNLYWLLKCECGNSTVKKSTSVKSGYAKSCGCLQREMTSKARRTHGDSDSRLYYVWENMRKRCYKPNSDRYKNYGARGIKVCDEWKDDYGAFMKWALSNGYKDNLTIDRNDVNGNYTPENCSWIPMAEQAKNRTTNKWIYINDQKLSPTDIEEKYNIPVKTVYARIARGDEGEAVARPLGKRQFSKRQPRGN